MRLAKPKDIDLLVTLMAEFYAEGGYALDRPRAALAFEAVLKDRRLGRIWIIQSGRQDVGHIVLTLKYAMEYGGIVGCVDDLYVRAAWRNKGLSTAALVDVKDFCEDADICALTVEVGFDNAPAQTVYRRTGFTELANRQLLALPLAAPAHIL
jgi:GNAT superfamily N-acetyltransferase